LHFTTSPTAVKTPGRAAVMTRLQTGTGILEEGVVFLGG
jgi:hypothetical protein